MADPAHMANDPYDDAVRRAEDALVAARQARDESRRFVAEQEAAMAAALKGPPPDYWQGSEQPRQTHSETNDGRPSTDNESTRQEAALSEISASGSAANASVAGLNRATANLLRMYITPEKCYSGPRRPDVLSYVSLGPLRDMPLWWLEVRRSTGADMRLHAGPGVPARELGRLDSLGRRDIQGDIHVQLSEEEISVLGAPPASLIRHDAVDEHADAAKHLASVQHSPISSSDYALPQWIVRLPNKPWQCVLIAPKLDARAPASLEVFSGKQTIGPEVKHLANQANTARHQGFKLMRCRDVVADPSTVEADMIARSKSYRRDFNRPYGTDSAGDEVVAVFTVSGRQRRRGDGWVGLLMFMGGAVAGHGVPEVQEVFRRVVVLSLCRILMEKQGWK